jgi:hypothetical protein
LWHETDIGFLICIAQDNYDGEALVVPTESAGDFSAVSARSLAPGGLDRFDVVESGAAGFELFDAPGAQDLALELQLSGRSTDVPTRTGRGR